jgi:hypothetical protein
VISHWDDGNVEQPHGSCVAVDGLGLVTRVGERVDWEVED